MGPVGLDCILHTVFKPLRVKRVVGWLIDLTSCPCSTKVVKYVDDHPKELGSGDLSVICTATARWIKSPEGRAGSIAWRSRAYSPQSHRGSTG